MQTLYCGICNLTTVDQQPLLLVLHLSDDLPDCIHQPLAFSAGNARQGGFGIAFCACLDHSVRLGNFLLYQQTELLDPPVLDGIVDRQTP